MGQELRLGDEKAPVIVDRPPNPQPSLWGADVEGLDSIPVPDSSAPWFDIWEFALTYNGYDRHGGFDGMAKIGNRAQRDWARRGTLPKGLGMARAALFFEQRRYHHFGTDPEDEDERYVRALLGRIAELGGGVVSGPPDPGP